MRSNRWVAMATLAALAGAHASRARIDGMPVPAVVFQAVTFGVGED